jgi:mannose-1-phosphate guanylyltransferase/phosphomannomutase
MAGRSVACPWDRKGLVMRALHDESRNGADVQMIDGIRIARSGGWVLVLPDASEASINILSEGTSDDDAARSADAMAARVSEIVTG